MMKTRVNTEKVAWSGRIVSIQPRIRLIRSFDERSHICLGYVLRVEGKIADEPGEFIIAIGKTAQAKHHFQAGMEVSGQAVPVSDQRLETAGFYKAGGLKIVKDAEGDFPDGPPFHGMPPDLETYRARGHRRLDARTYDVQCATCTWGCRMPVEMIIDHWNPSRKRCRFETFCYGPKSCALYRAVSTRKVLGRKGMSYTEDDWVDEDATSHRGLDD